jgi:hypothetical protein
VSGSLRTVKVPLETTRGIMRRIGAIGVHRIGAIGVHKIGAIGVHRIGAIGVHRIRDRCA